MEITPEMREMMERTMEQYYAAWWQKHATPEQEAKRVAEGKTFKGAYHFAHTVAEHYRNKPNGENCVAMPDELAYWILAHYMENEPEGSEYKTPDEIEAARKRELEKAEAKRKKAEEAAAKKRAELEAKAEALNADALIPVSADDVSAAEARASAARAEVRAAKAAIKADVARAEALSAKIEQGMLF